MNDIRFIDNKSKDTIKPKIYSEICLEITKNKLTAQKVLKSVLLGSRFVLFLDLFYETNDLKYKQKALKIYEKLIQILSSRQKKQLNQLYLKLNTFWDYEKSLGLKSQFSKKERIFYLKRKSSDVFFYSLLSNFIFKLPSEIESILYLRQQLNDIFDDCTDIKEDKKNNSPNLILMFNKKYNSVKELKSYEREEIRTIATKILTDILKKQNNITILLIDAIDLYLKILETIY